MNANGVQFHMNGRLSSLNEDGQETEMKNEGGGLDVEGSQA